MFKSFNWNFLINKNLKSLFAGFFFAARWWTRSWRWTAGASTASLVLLWRTFLVLVTWFLLSFLLWRFWRGASRFSFLFRNYSDWWSCSTLILISRCCLSYRRGLSLVHVSRSWASHWRWTIVSASWWTMARASWASSLDWRTSARARWPLSWVIISLIPSTVVKSSLIISLMIESSLLVIALVVESPRIGISVISKVILVVARSVIAWASWSPLWVNLLSFASVELFLRLETIEVIVNCVISFSTPFNFGDRLWEVDVNTTIID